MNYLILLNAYVLCEVNVKGQVGFIIVSYLSPTQTSPQFDDFLSNFEKFFDDVQIFQPAFAVILGDFNARSKSWWSDDSTAIEDPRLDSLISIHGFHHLIFEPTHILLNLLSYIDFIFTNQPGLEVDNGVHSTLHEICHHQVRYCKLNLKIEQPPPYERLVWDFKRADVNAITTAINQVNYKFIFSCKNVNQNLNIFNKTIINIFFKFYSKKACFF